MYAKPRRNQRIALISILVLIIVTMTGFTNSMAVANTSTLSVAPARVADVVFPGTLALVSHYKLYLMEGKNPQSKMVQVNLKGSAQIVGWSADGQWLMYLQRQSDDYYADLAYLWVVRYDGSQKIQIDSLPILDQAYSHPQWSPKGSSIVYQVIKDKSTLQDAPIRIATITGGAVKVSTILAKGAIENAYAWYSDGAHVLISEPTTTKSPLTLSKLALDGKKTKVISMGKPKAAKDEIYSLFACAFKFAPSGRYVSFFIHPNSGSLSTDGCELKVLDLANNKIQQIGFALYYPEWTAWSADNRLAFISGAGREVTSNKQLAVVDFAASKKVVVMGSQKSLDTQPSWVDLGTSTFLFCRGKASQHDWADSTKSKPLVPGQRIWQLTASNQLKALTTGDEQTADYYPQLIEKGKGLVFLRVGKQDEGSIMYKDLKSGKQVALVKGLTGDVGFYGNYLPVWLSYSAQE